MSPACASGSDGTVAGAAPRVAQLLPRFYPDYRDETRHFHDLIRKYLHRGMRVLDAGCGRGVGPGSCLQDFDGCLVGVDVGPHLAENTVVRHRVRGRLEDLPLGNESFDLVVTRYVVEHLRDPLSVFREIARVLRPGGNWVLLTPNLWHYVSLTAALTPDAFHRWVNARRGISAQDVFPTVYRANTPGRLRSLARQAGLELVELNMIETRPNYLLFSVPSFMLGVLYERVVNRFSWLSRLRVNILAVARKPA